MARGIQVFTQKVPYFDQSIIRCIAKRRIYPVIALIDVGFPTMRPSGTLTAVLSDTSRRMSPLVLGQAEVDNWSASSDRNSEANR